jgi:hypothetical protein
MQNGAFACEHVTRAVNLSYAVIRRWAVLSSEGGNRQMVKMFYFFKFFKRRANMSPDEFHRYLREQHAPLFCNTGIARRYVVRYEQNHTAPENAGIAGDDFDGVSVMWFRSVDDLHAMRADPKFRDVVLPDGEKIGADGSGNIRYARVS